MNWLKDALKASAEEGYILFPEIRDVGVIQKIKENPAAKRTLDEITEYTERVLGDPSPVITYSMINEYRVSGNRRIYEKPYFERRKQFFSLILQYVLYGDDNLLPVIEDRLWEWCDLYTWEVTAHISFDVEAAKNGVPGPDQTVALFSAESGFFFAEILWILDGKLDEFLVYRLKAEIIRRVIEPFKENHYWWEEAKMNWSAVCAGAVGAAAIYLIEDAEELSAILDRVIHSMDIFMEAFDKDGLITEGLSYWEYGFSFYMYFAELLKERTNGEISLLQGNEKIKRIAELPQYLQFPSELFVNFSDAGTGKWQGNHGIFRRLEKVLNVQGYSYPEKEDVYRDHTHRWASMARRLFWSWDRDMDQSSSIKTGMFYFSESQWLVDRRIGKSGKFTAFAAKGGHNDEPHNHNDLGHFILHHDGSNIFIDIGSPEYVRQYFEKETRYAYLAASSKGHSVPEINGLVQAAGGEYFAKVLECKEEADEVIYTLDLTKAYDSPTLDRFVREFRWNYQALQLDIQDSFAFTTRDNEVKEVFITESEPKPVEQGKIVIHTGVCMAELSFSPELSYEIVPCSYRDHQGRDAVIYRTEFLAKSIEEKKEIRLTINIQ